MLDLNSSLKKSQYILPAAAAVSWISFQILLGILLGFWLGKIYLENFYGRKFGRISLNSLILKFGNYKLHVHHWLIFLAALMLGFHWDVSLLSSKIFYGIICGIIIQDIYCDKDWYKIVKKRD